MKKIRIGVLSPSEIAFRRFMPSLKKLDNYEYVGIAYANSIEWFGKNLNVDKSVLENERTKAKAFQETYGGVVLQGYEHFLQSDLIDAIYIPLPPALHFKWAKLALENGKHVLLEKPFTTSFEDTKNLIDIANSKDLALHENYMFIYHSQIDYVQNIINNNTLGNIKLISINFGFPFRGGKDFRYQKKLGGGALLDCGGYTLKLAQLIMGEVEILSSYSGYKDGFEVDIYGFATLKNKNGQIANVSFGMDNAYRCSLDLWGTNGQLFTNRILTAPDDYKPIFNIEINGIKEEIILEADETFKKSILCFSEFILNNQKRQQNYLDILKQSQLMREFIDRSGGSY